MLKVKVNDDHAIFLFNGRIDKEDCRIPMGDASTPEETFFKVRR